MNAWYFDKILSIQFHRSIYKCFSFCDRLIWIFFLFLKLFLLVIVWMGHLRILVHCVIVRIKLGHIQCPSAIHATASREPFVQEVFLVVLSLDSEHRVSGRLLILFALLGLGNIAEEIACFLRLSLFFLHHRSDRLWRFKFNRKINISV